MHEIDKYLGHPAQLYGAELYRAVGGRADGMRMLTVRNGSGIEMTIAADRNADIARFSFNGVNLGFLAPAGFVNPMYYDVNRFAQSFTAGFMTTCGLTNAGNSCEDDGEVTAVHGTIANTPCDEFSYWTDDKAVHVASTARDAALFQRQLKITREYTFPLFGDSVTMRDTVENVGPYATPYMILYHCNFAYPLVQESSRVIIPSKKVTPRTPRAAEGMDKYLVMEPPVPGFAEQCYYHEFDGVSTVGVESPDAGVALYMTFDAAENPFFTEWKNMGAHEYVLGLEPGNCIPDGRDVMRKSGKLTILEPGESRSQTLSWTVKGSGNF